MSAFSVIYSFKYFRWNKFWRVPYAFKILSAPTGAIIGGANNEMTNTMLSHMHLYKERPDLINRLVMSSPLYSIDGPDRILQIALVAKKYQTLFGARRR